MLVTLLKFFKLVKSDPICPLPLIKYVSIHDSPNDIHEWHYPTKRTDLQNFLLKHLSFTCHIAINNLSHLIIWQFYPTRILHYMVAMLTKYFTEIYHRTLMWYLTVANFFGFAINQSMNVAGHNLTHKVALVDLEN